MCTVISCTHFYPANSFIHAWLYKMHRFILCINEAKSQIVNKMNKKGAKCTKREQSAQKVSKPKIRLLDRCLRIAVKKMPQP